MDNPKLKKWALITAITLPVVLVAAVWLSSHFKSLKSPPTYNLIYAQSDSWRTKMEAQDNHVYLQYRFSDEKEQGQSDFPQLFVYDVKTQKSEPLLYESPVQFIYSREWQKISVLNFDKQDFVAGIKAPDGYRYESRHHYGGIAEGLAHAHRRYNHVIVKENDVVVFSHHKGRIDFIGWLKPNSGAQNDR
jgi:hypothetical protein